MRSVKATREVQLAELGVFDSLMLSLSEEHYQPLTFSIVANYLSNVEKPPAD